LQHASGLSEKQTQKQKHKENIVLSNANVVPKVTAAGERLSASTRSLCQQATHAPNAALTTSGYAPLKVGLVDTIGWVLPGRAHCICLPGLQAMAHV
jgi:hypothetical protein